MNMQQIEIALSVAKHLSFSMAAVETSFALSTVSKQIFALEEELGVKLFERNARSKVSLTTEGEALLPDLQRLAADSEQLWNHVHTLLGGKGQRLIVGCPDGLSTLGEDELIVDFCAIYPEIAVNQILAGITPTLFEMLMLGQIDLAFIVRVENEYENQLQNPSISILDLGELHLKLVLNEHHHAVKNGMVDLADLRDEVFLFRSFRDNMECDPKVRCFVDACAQEGFVPNLRFVQMRHSTVFNIAAVGQGVIPLMHRPRTVYPGVTFVPTKKNYYTFSLTACYLKRNRSPALKKFLGFLRQRKQDLAQIGE